MKTYTDFTTEAYGRRGPRPVRGRDYEDFKGLPKPSGDLGGKFQGGWLKKKEERKKSAAERMDAAGKKLGLPEEVEIDEGIGMTMAGALGNPPALSKRMKLKRALIVREIEKNTEKNKKKKYSGKAKEEVNELFVTRKSPEQRADEKRRKKVAELIRLMKYAKDTHSDVARKPVAKEEYIDETSLNRVRSKSEKGGMAIMSAQRGDKSKSENKARSKQLEKDIRGSGLPGPTKVSGRYTENPGTSQEKKVGEKSHVVSSGKMGKRKFKKAITKLGKKYNQDSVLIQKKPKGSAQLVGTNKSWPGEGKRVKVGKMNPGKTGEFDTKVKNKTFTYEEYEN